MNRLIFIFYFVIINCMINYIISSLFFVKPMCNKYKIMAPDIPNDIKGRYKFIFFDIVVIGFYFYILSFFFESKLFLSILAVIHIIIGLYYFNKYRRWDILEYINYFSADLFDWDKIYILPIPKEIKERCFAIHYMDYEYYEQTYIEHLERKKRFLEYEIQQTKNQKSE